MPAGQSQPIYRHPAKRAKPDVPRPQRTSRNCPQRIRIGADFCGQLTCCMALKAQGLATEIAWACDKDEAVRTLIDRNFSPSMTCDHVQNRSSDNLPDCNLYMCTPPCIAFSPSNVRRQGPNDEKTGQLSFTMLEIAIVKKPQVIVYENVPEVTRYTDFWTQLMDGLRAAGYQVAHSVLNGINFGVPPNRKRLYMVAVHSRCCLAPFIWPDPVQTPTLTEFFGLKLSKKKKA